MGQVTTEESIIRESIANELEKFAMLAVRSNEYNFHDTAIRAKTFVLAADIVRGK